MGNTHSIGPRKVSPCKSAEGISGKQFSNITEFLPPYSPELNPIERVWKTVKSKGTHHRYFLTMGDLIWAVTEQFAVYAKPNSAPRRLCGFT